MAHTSLADQLRKLATPQTNILFHRKTRPSLLFDPSEAAEIDRSTFYEIGISGLNELKEVNEVFEEFRTSLFDETSKSFERAVETFDVNHKLNKIIKKFLYLASPYFLLKPTQKALEWLIVRFHIHEYNGDELICSALPYHGTRLFARLIQVFDLKKSNPQWQWLYPLQKKGIPLSKTALFNHCASDVNFLKMICDLTVDAVKIFEPNASKLTTLFGFYSTTIIGTIQTSNEVTELHLTHMLPSIFLGLSSDCVDYCASALMIISSIFIKSTFQERFRSKLTEKIAKIKHVPLQKSVVLLLNIMYQSEKLEEVSLSPKAIKNLAESSEWFIPAMKTFLSSGIHTNIFYLLLIRDGLRLISECDENKQRFLQFTEKLINSCKVDDSCAQKMIRIVIDEARKKCDKDCCKLVKKLENQYPSAWDSVVASLFEEEPDESLSHVLGFTSATTQIEIFQQLNHPVASIRAEAIKNIANNPDSFKISYIKSSLRARWNDEDPSVIEAMFLLPEKLKFYSAQTFEKLLLRSWLESKDKWNSLLLKILQSLKVDIDGDFSRDSTKYLILLLPFLMSSSKKVQDAILHIRLPLFDEVRNNSEHNLDAAVIDAIINGQHLPSVEDLIEVYQSLSPAANVHIFTFVLLLSFMYENCDIEDKAKILHFFFDDIFPVHFKKVKWKLDIKWNDDHLRDYYQQTSHKLPLAVAYKFFGTIIEQTTVEKEFSCSDWCDFTDENLNLIALLYKYLNRCSEIGNDIGYKIFLLPLVEKFSETLSGQLGFLCNMCVVHQREPEIHLQTLKMMEQLLVATKESYSSWALDTKSYNIFVPSLLISLYSTESSIRSQVMQIVDRLAESIGLALTKRVTYAHFLKHLRQFSQEIILDRDELLTRLYAFLAQDDDVQSLLPVAVRCFTKIFHDLFLDCVIDERTPLLVSASLLQTLDYLRDSTVIRKLAPLARRIVSANDYPNEAGSQVVRSFIDKFNVASLEVLEDEHVFAFLEHCVNNFASVKIRTENGVVSVGTLVLQKFSVDLFDALDTTMQKFFLDFVLRVCSDNKASDVVPAANSFVKKINLDCELLEPYFTNMKMLNLSKTEETSQSTENEPSVLRRPEWRMGIALLELMQNKKKLTNCHLIVPSLFAVLEKCCEVDDHLPMEYAKQVCLSCVLNCSQKMTSSMETKRLEALFNVELIVKCIRMSPNPQTHHHALLLLAHGASFAPNQVLHNIMAIFTFMGSSVLRQDDAFSLQIISNILETIVPLLVKRVDSQELSESAIVHVLRVFAATIPDIPDHRRIPLLKKLMEILHDGEYMHLLVILSMASCAKSTVPSKSMAAKYVEVLQELLLKFPPQISLTTFQKVITYVNQLPHNMDDKNIRLDKEIKDLFDLKKHSNKELCHFKYLLLNFTAAAVSGQKFIEQISTLSIDELLSFESHFKGIIEQIILYIRGILDFTASSKVASAKYWKVMISQALEILNKTNALLTCETFIIVVKDLIEHDCLLVQRKSVELLNWRLQAAKEGTLKDEFSSKSLTSLIPSLMKIIDTIGDDAEDNDVSHDLKLNQQTALISIKLLVKQCSASGHILPFKRVLSQLIKLQSKNMNEHVLASLILCVAELMATLKVHAIDGLPKFVPALIALFEPYQTEEIAPNDVILICIITALQKIVETLPNFLSPYLESILCEICRITTLLNNNVTENKSEDKPSGIVHKLNLIEQKIAAEVPSRVLWPSISSSFVRSCEARNLNSIKPLLSILVASFPKNCQISPELTSIFLSMFDYRCATKSASDDDISLVEEYCIEALCSIVLKCSESTFRPFYHKLYDWGVIASKDHLKSDRILTYYKILFSLSESLKSIFVLFASNFVRNAVELLDKNNVSKGEQNSDRSYVDDAEKCVLLVDSILKTLHNVFKYDTVKFLTKDRFNLLLEPLVNQIENTVGDYKSRSEDVIIPCIARFGAATSDDSLWKQFNYLVLLKTRHLSPEVRLTALETICTFATHLGDNFLPFLPESVPFFVELLEDENETVEKQSHKAVQRLEQTLNESVRRYF